ncbi:WhiB family transcriptional regulator [Rhodococcus sp. UNC363MFTsu5.1]|uniref:WhiB family transcriptional regulator n=1 Tax=Rhodococcus sp. UNC363MFTsu5.1 TaxID=1449069 RepID=UPI0006913EAB|nr:WhiB family transcriptional regulator [Rhodococcus sp. UNC363MFTsu5.1]
MINTLRHTHQAAYDAPEDWSASALCRTIPDPDRMFIRGSAQQRKVAALCRHCPVIQQCGAEALDNRVESGVWGGMTEIERRNLLMLYPHIRSWAAFIARAHNTNRSRTIFDAMA